MVIIQDVHFPSTLIRSCYILSLHVFFSRPGSMSDFQNRYIYRPITSSQLCTRLDCYSVISSVLSLYKWHSLICFSAVLYQWVSSVLKASCQQKCVNIKEKLTSARYSSFCCRSSMQRPATWISSSTCLLWS